MKPEIIYSNFYSLLVNLNKKSFKVSSLNLSLNSHVFALKSKSTIYKYLTEIFFSKRARKHQKDGCRSIEKRLQINSR